MSRELVNEICAAQPGAVWSDPWGGGHDCWKVGGKTFAVTGAHSGLVSVKTDSIETAAFLIETGVGERAPYLHKSWVALPLDSAPDELAHRIRHSYRLVRAGLTRAAQAGLPPL